jgi:uncharacterized protein (TIGR02266 family)
MRDQSVGLAQEIQGPVERRRRRLSPPLMILKAEAQNGARTLFGYAKNISRGGLMISSINPKEPGDRFDLEITLPHPLPQVSRCQCEVVWQRLYSKTRAHEPGMGLKFLDLPEPAASAIDDWIHKSVAREDLWQ